MFVLFLLSSFQRCTKNRRCSKADRHEGRCNNSLPINPFWLNSPYYKLNLSRSAVKTDANRLETENAVVNALKEEVKVKAEAATAVIEKASKYRFVLCWL